jgi:transposase-like protein
MMAERGLSVDHTTIFRWVQAYAPELARRVRPHLKQTTASWRVDETDVKVTGRWMDCSEPSIRMVPRSIVP